MDLPGWNVIAERVQDYLLNALPAAAYAVYAFIKDWQTLIAGVLIVFAARYFFEGMLRSSRITAEAILRSARIAGDGPRRVTSGEGASQPPAQIQPMLGAPAQSAAPAGASLGERLEALRDAVRSALAAIPTTGNEIGIKGAALYGRVATFSFDDIDPAIFDKPALALFRELQTALDSLRLDSGKITDARHAWERLVRINKLARELRGKAAPGAAPLEKAIVKKIG